MDYWFDVLIALIAGICPLLGVLIGAKLTAKQTLEEYRREQGLAACVDFLSIVLSSSKVPAERRSDMAVGLGLATGKIQLLCSERIASLAMRISDQVLQKGEDRELLGILINEFIESSKQEMRNG